SRSKQQDQRPKKQRLNANRNTFVLRGRRWRETPEVEEVEVVGIAPRAIRHGAFAKRALHSPPAPAKGDKKRFDKLSVPLQPIGSATALRQAQRTKGRNKGQGVSRLNGLAHH